MRVAARLPPDGDNIVAYSVGIVVVVVVDAVSAAAN